MTGFSLQSNPAAQSYRLLDFDSVTVTPGIINGTFFLTVTGSKPCLNMRVELSPLIYIRCPEYWGIEVVGHLPHGLCLPAMGRYEETIELTGITGSRGIEVIGASGTERRDVTGGCSDAQDFSAAANGAGKQFIVIALSASAGDKHQGCSIVSEDASYPAIYSQVFGPASREHCERWIGENCGFDGGDPA
jgi:hypothetical protein